MLQFSLTHELDCGLREFWELFFDRYVMETMFREVLEFTEYRLLDQVETEDAIFRKSQGQPRTNLKIFGSGFRYTEDGVFVKAENVWRWEIIPATLPDRIRSRGTLRAAPLGASKVRREFSGFVDAAIFGIGPALEETFQKRAVEGSDKSAAFLNEWVRQGRHTRRETSLAGKEP
jgi:hypothetical protein